MSLLRQCGTSKLLRACGTSKLLVSCPPPPPICDIGTQFIATVDWNPPWFGTTVEIYGPAMMTTATGAIPGWGGKGAYYPNIGRFRWSIMLPWEALDAVMFCNNDGTFYFKMNIHPSTEIFGTGDIDTALWVGTHNNIVDDAYGTVTLEPA